ncbi:MAG: redoxin domain-containing protein [Clostridia bacterium]|nr:redoxin domain-containing protein [Clostridia bacterium]
MKKLLAALIALALCLSCFALAGAETEPTVYALGNTIEDFTVTTFNGQTVTLSELLKEKDMVLLNLWATWCGPCENEFPAMEQAYEQYQDRIAIVALSVEPEDTDEVLADYVAEHGMTFFVGRDEPDFATKFDIEGIPTSVVIDRNGVICYIECGSMPDPASFAMIFDMFIGEDYAEPVILTEAPGVLPTVDREDPATLAAALEVETVANPEIQYIWPMVSAEADGRSVVKPSNTGLMAESTAALDIPLEVPDGSVIAVTAKLDTDAGYDTLTFDINGVRVKGFSGKMDWFTYAIPIEHGGYVTLTLSYLRISRYAYGDEVFIDSVAVLTGDEAAAALAANPVYPYGDTVSIIPVGENVREIEVSDPDMLEYLVGTKTCYILNGEEATYAVTINRDVDPDADTFYSDSDGSLILLRDGLTENGFVFTAGTDAADTNGYPYTCAFVHWDSFGSYQGITVFRDEANANYFFYRFLTDYGYDGLSWSYPDGTAPARDLMPEVMLDPGMVDTSEYTVRYVDQDGNPVNGVTFQITDNSTTLFTTQEDGAVTWWSAPVACEIQTMELPEGYEGNTQTVYHMPEEGGMLEIPLTRK